MKLWDSSKEDALQERAKAEVSDAVKRAEEIADTPIEQYFDAMYAEIPEELKLQRDTLRTSSLGQEGFGQEIQTPTKQGIEETVN